MKKARAKQKASAQSNQLDLWPQAHQPQLKPPQPQSMAKSKSQLQKLPRRRPKAAVDSVSRRPKQQARLRVKHERQQKKFFIKRKRRSLAEQQLARWLAQNRIKHIWFPSARARGTGSVPRGAPGPELGVPHFLIFAPVPNQPQAHGVAILIYSPSGCSAPQLTENQTRYTRLKVAGKK